MRKVKDKKAKEETLKSVYEVCIRIETEKVFNVLASSEDEAVSFAEENHGTLEPVEIYENDWDSNVTCVARYVCVSK